VAPAILLGDVLTILKKPPANSLRIRRGDRPCRGPRKANREPLQIHEKIPHPRHPWSRNLSPPNSEQRSPLEPENTVEQSY